MPPDRRGNLALPFFHLRSDSFWHLVPKPGKQGVLEDAAQIRSLARLQDAVIGTRLDDKTLRASPGTGGSRCASVRPHRDLFSPELRPSLIEQGAINNEAIRYSEELLRRDQHEVAEAVAEV
jgi:putative restriction endonuclease